ncbi:MAG: glycosyltransferase, partial [Chloroflexi bacterium]
EQPDKLTILFVGRLQARKRIDNLLHACASLPQSIQPRLIIVGDGPARHDFEGLASSVYPEAQFTGEKHGKGLESLFLEADLFVLPGTGGLAVQQAMSYALPVIVAEGDGTQDDLVRPVNGLRIASDDVQALKDALQFMLSDFSRLRQMGAASYRIVTEEVNLEKMAEVFIRAACTVRGEA